MNDLIPKKFLDGTDTLAEANKLEVTDDMGNALAATMGGICADEIKIRKKYFKPLKDQAHTLHKSLVAAEKESLKPYEDAKRVLMQASLGYEQEQERIRAEKEAKIRKEAEEKERVRQEEIEKNREAAKEDPELTFEEPEEEEAFQPEDIVIAPTFKKQGQTRVTWHAEVTSLDDFYRYVITNGAWDLIQPNQQILEARAKEAKADSKIAGVKFFTTSTKVY